MSNDPIKIPTLRPAIATVGPSRGVVLRGPNMTFFKPEGETQVYVVGYRGPHVGLDKAFKCNDFDRKAWSKLAGWKIADTRAAVAKERLRREHERAEADIRCARIVLESAGYRVTKPRAKK
jgi:hypothetical protein